MADYGVKVAQSGFDVGTALPQNLAFSSAHFANKVFLQGNINIPCTTPSGTFFYGLGSVVHGLTYTPIHLCYGNLNGVYVTQGHLDAGNNVVFDVNRSPGTVGGSAYLSLEMYQQVSGTYSARYYIFYDQGT